MYHLELRQFPHNLCHFNLDEPELRAFLARWTSEPSIEIEEQKWIPHQANLKILEGPRIPLSQLSMGRGWRTAERQSEDVTERVLAEASQTGAAAAAPSATSISATSPPASAPGSPQGAQPDSALVADSLGLELLAQLANGPEPLSTAWKMAAGRYLERSPSETLALAERAVRSLLKARLIVLTRSSARAGAREGAPEEGSDLEDAQVEPALRALECWLAQGEAAVVDMRRA